MTRRLMTARDKFGITQYRDGKISIGDIAAVR